MRKKYLLCRLWLAWETEVILGFSGDVPISADSLECSEGVKIHLLRSSRWFGISDYPRFFWRCVASLFIQRYAFSSFFLTRWKALRVRETDLPRSRMCFGKSNVTLGFSGDVLLCLVSVVCFSPLF
jgi:hypothetical protein